LDFVEVFSGFLTFVIAEVSYFWKEFVTFCMTIMIRKIYQLTLTIRIQVLLLTLIFIIAIKVIIA